MYLEKVLRSLILTNVLIDIAVSFAYLLASINNNASREIKKKFGKARRRDRE